MNRRYFIEEDENINIDVQVGPEEEVEVTAEPEEAVPSPVDIAKSAPENVPVAAVAHDNDDPEAGNDIKKLEFYVDLDDVSKYADLNEMSILEALNSIIYCNEEHGMRADNTVIMVSESCRGYVRQLEKHGAACQMIREAEGDIQIDVQVGPNGEDMQVEADPQEANPVDAVKREYDNVVVAKQGDEFFMDVEDVQKCADLNCESVIATLNNIIKVNEDTDISADNIVLVVKENSVADFGALEEAGVDIRFFLTEAGTKIGDVSGLNVLANKIITNCKSIARKIKGDVQADEKKIKEQIDHMNKLIDRIDEEIAEASKEGYKPSIGTIAKNFVGFAGQMVIAMVYAGAWGAGGLVVGGKIGQQIDIAVYGKKYGKETVKAVTNDIIKDNLKNFSIKIAVITPIVSTIYGAMATSAFLKDYVKSLHTWKEQVESIKSDLEKKLK